MGLNEPLNWDLPSIRYLQWNLAKEIDYFREFRYRNHAPEGLSVRARQMCLQVDPVYGRWITCDRVSGRAQIATLSNMVEMATWQIQKKTGISCCGCSLTIRIFGTAMGASGRDLVRCSYSVDQMWPRYSAILAGALLR